MSDEIIARVIALIKQTKLLERKKLSYFPSRISRQTSGDEPFVENHNNALRVAVIL